MHIYCDFLLLTSKEKLFEPPLFLGWRRHCRAVVYHGKIGMSFGGWMSFLTSSDLVRELKGYARRGLSEARLTEARARALVPQ